MYSNTVDHYLDSLGKPPPQVNNGSTCKRTMCACISFDIIPTLEIQYSQFGIAA